MSSEKTARSFNKALFYPLKSKAENKFDVYGFDVETLHKQNNFSRKSGKEVNCMQQDFLMGSVYGKDGYKVFWDREDMREYLLNRKFRDSVIFATNLEFDFMQLYHDMIEKFHIIYNNSLLAAIYGEKQNDKKRKWVFNDTMNFMRSSLKKVGEIVGVEKLGPPSTFEKTDIGLISRQPENARERKELIEYNINDSKITYLFAKKMRDFCTMHNMKMKLTIGSTGMDYWRRNHQKFPLKREHDEMVMKHFNGSFKGGMTQVFKRGLYDGKLWYYDYRSSYPRVMVDGVDGKGDYPDPSSYAYTHHGSTEIIELYDGIAHCKVKAPYDYIPYLGNRADDKLIFGYGNFEGWFTNFELRKAMDYGYEVDVGEMIYYRNNMRPFKEAVKYLYKLRKKYKAEKSDYQAMVKVLMNSGLFGKWGTNPNNMQEIISLKNVHFRDGVPYYNNKKLDNFRVDEFNNDLFSGFVSVKKKAKPFKYSFPIWSEYTTALGRNRLLCHIKDHEEQIIYCDTDSAIVKKPCFEEGDELGDWELEHKLKGGLFIKPKLYMIFKDDEDVICKSKGVGKFMNTRDKFMKSLNEGKVEMERFTKMKESNNIGIKSGSVIRMFKRIGVEDDKRNWLGQRFRFDDFQDSKPLRIIDGVTEFRYNDLMKKARDAYEREQERQMKAFINSDQFDKFSVGSDISAEEFIKNEQDFREYE